MEERYDNINGLLSNSTLVIPCDQSSLPTKVSYFDLGTDGLQTNIHKPCVHMCIMKWWVQFKSMIRVNPT